MPRFTNNPPCSRIRRFNTASATAHRWTGSYASFIPSHLPPPSSLRSTLMLSSQVSNVAGSSCFVFGVLPFWLIFFVIFSSPFRRILGLVACLRKLGNVRIGYNFWPFDICEWIQCRQSRLGSVTFACAGCLAPDWLSGNVITGISLCDCVASWDYPTHGFSPGDSPRASVPTYDSQHQCDIF